MTLADVERLQVTALRGLIDTLTFCRGTWTARCGTTTGSGDSPMAAVQALLRKHTA